MKPVAAVAAGLVMLAVACSADAQLAQSGPAPAGEVVQVVSTVIPSLDDEVARIAEDFRRLRKGCLQNSKLEFSLEDEMTYRRVYPSGFTELGNRVAMSNFCEFKAVELITNFFAEKTFDQAFSEFLAERPSSKDLAAELDRILDARQSDPQGPVGVRFDSVFAIPQLAYLAVMQPYLARINPEARKDIGEIIMDRWLTEDAYNPDRYKSRDGILRVFEEVRQKGYIEYWSSR